MIRINLRNESDLPYEILGKKLDNFDWDKADDTMVEKIYWYDKTHLEEKTYNMYTRKINNGYNVRVALCLKIRKSKFDI